MEPAGPVTSDRDHSAFIFGIGDNLSEFIGDVVGILGLTTKSSKHGTSAVDPLFLDKVTGGLGKKVKTNAEDQTPSKLDTNRDTVGSGICPVLGGVCNTRGEKKANCDACESRLGDRQNYSMGGTHRIGIQKQEHHELFSGKFRTCRG